MSRRVAAAVCIVALGMLLPTGVAAAGDCKLTVEPTTVHVGEAFTVMGTGFTPNGDGAGFNALDSQNELVLLTFQPDGTITWDDIARDFEVGHLTLKVVDEENGCTASVGLTVLPAPVTPGTDTVSPTPQVPVDTPVGAIGVVALLGLGAGWRYPRRRVR